MKYLNISPAEKRLASWGPGLYLLNLLLIPGLGT